MLNRVRRALAIERMDLELPTDRQTGRRVANAFVAGLVLKLSCHRNFLPISKRSNKCPRAVDSDLIDDAKFAFEHRDALVNGRKV